MLCVASENVTSSHSTRRPVTLVWVSLIRECPRRVNCARTNAFFVNEILSFRLNVRGAMNCATTNERGA